jgi:hypothetical protein
VVLDLDAPPAGTPARAAAPVAVPLGLAAPAPAGRVAIPVKAKR